MGFPSMQSTRNHGSIELLSFAVLLSHVRLVANRIFPLLLRNCRGR